MSGKKNYYYKKYLNKKIKVTGLSVNKNKSLNADKFVTISISYNNKNSLD